MRAQLLSIFCGLLTLTGCSICPPGYLDDYATIGGRYQRLDPTTGRVGSAFSDPGTQEVHLENNYVSAPYSGEYMAPIHHPAEIQGGEGYVGESIVAPRMPSDPPSFDIEDGTILDNVEVVPAPQSQSNSIIQGSGSK